MKTFFKMAGLVAIIAACCLAALNNVSETAASKAVFEQPLRSCQNIFDTFTLPDEGTWYFVPRVTVVALTVPNSDKVNFEAHANVPYLVTPEPNTGAESVLYEGATYLHVADAMSDKHGWVLLDPETGCKVPNLR